jgi:CheY-like chemotaxis protein
MFEDDPEQNPFRILVVDDNVDAAVTLSTLLELEGYQISTAFNGQEAVTAATQDCYHVVLLDLNMPVMDGFEAARALRKLQPAPKLIACSACDDMEARRRTSQLGFSAHLTKPIPVDFLLDTLKQHSRAVSDHPQPVPDVRCCTPPVPAGSAAGHESHLHAQVLSPVPRV